MGGGQRTVPRHGLFHPRTQPNINDDELIHHSGSTLKPRRGWWRRRWSWCWKWTRSRRRRGRRKSAGWTMSLSTPYWQRTFKSQPPPHVQAGLQPLLQCQLILHLFSWSLHPHARHLHQGKDHESDDGCWTKIELKSSSKSGFVELPGTTVLLHLILWRGFNLIAVSDPPLFHYS